MAYINRLTDINKGLTDLNKGQNSMNSKLLNIDGNIDSTLQLLETSLPAIITAVGNISSSGLATETTLLDVKTNTARIASTNTKLDTIHNDLDGLTFDGSSNLNVNIASGTISIGSVNIKNTDNTDIKLMTIDDQLQCDSRLYSSGGDALTATIVSGTVTALDVNISNTSALNVNDTTTQTKLDTINTNIGTTNTTLSTIDGKVPSGLSVSSSRLLSNAQASAYSLTSSAIENLTCVSPFGTVNTKALHTYSMGAGYWDVSGSYVPFNMSTVGAKYCLNVNALQKAIKSYTFGGIDNNATAYRVIGGNATASGIALDGTGGYSFGLANPRPYYARTTTGTPTTTLTYDYVNSSGDLVENATASVSNTAWTTLATSVSIIKFTTSTTIGSVLDSTQSLSISPATDTNKSICHSSIANYGVAVFTIPNGYIGYITAITAGYSTAGSLIMVKWDVNGVRQPIYKVNIETSLNIVIPAGYEGMIGGIFTAGESIAFTNNLTTANKLVQASITLKSLT